MIQKVGPLSAGDEKFRLQQLITGFNQLVDELGGGDDLSLSWDDITDKPTTLAGFGITDPVVESSTSTSTHNALVRWFGTSGRIAQDSGVTLTDTDDMLGLNTVQAIEFIGTFTGVADEAIKLQTARTLWGQSFDGTADVTGALTNVGNITGTAGVVLTATAATLGLAATLGNAITFTNNAIESGRFNGLNQLLLGHNSPATGGAKLDVVHGTAGAARTVILSDILTDATLKIAGVQVRHYTNSEEPLATIIGRADAATSRVFIGGGVSAVNAATAVEIYTAATTTTTTGTVRATWDSSGVLNQHADSRSIIVGGGTNVSVEISFAGARALVGYNGVNAFIEGGLTKGVAFVINDTIQAGLVTSAGLWQLGSAATTTPATGTPAVDIYSAGGIALIITDAVTDATAKSGRFGVRHYTNTEEPAAIIAAFATTSANQVNIGGGTSVMNAATEINFLTAANNTTVTGTVALTISSTQALNHTGVSASLVQGATAIVNVGAAASTATFLRIRGAAATDRNIEYYTGTSLRWSLRVNSSTESGANAGSEFQIIARADDGSTLIDSPLQIIRAAGGTMTLTRPVNHTGATFNASQSSTTASLTVGLNTGAGATDITIRSAVAFDRSIYWRTGTSARWRMYVSATAESGSDAGSNFLMQAFTDAGALIDNVISLNRAAGGTFTLSRSFTQNGQFAALAQGTSGNAFATVGSGTQSGLADLRLDTSALNYARLMFRRAGLDRWALYMDNTAEAGSDAGSQLTWAAHTDAGVFIDNVLRVTRAAAGTIAFSATRPITGFTYNGQTINATANFTGTMNVVTSVTSASFIGPLTGNASTATALQTARNIWGQSFNGTADVTGAMSNVTTITATGLIQTTLTTEQLRLAYDGSNYISVTVGSTGVATFDSISATTPGFIFNDIVTTIGTVPVAGNTTSIGLGAIKLGDTTGTGWGVIRRYTAFTSGGLVFNHSDGATETEILRITSGTVASSKLLSVITGGFGVGTGSTATAVTDTLINFGNGTTTNPIYFRFTGPDTEHRAIEIYTDVTSSSNIRWRIGADDTAETGSEAGSIFTIRSFPDVGGSGNISFTMTRNLDEAAVLYRALVINENGRDADTRIEGDVRTHAFFLDANVESIALCATGAPAWQSMVGGLFLATATTAPTGNPTGGFFAYVDPADNRLKVRGPSGTITPLANP